MTQPTIFDHLNREQRQKDLLQAAKWLERAPTINPFDGIQLCMLAKATYKGYGLQEEWDHAQLIENTISPKLGL